MTIKRKPLLGVAAAVTVLAAMLGMLTGQRQTDGRFTHSITAEGDERFRFGSPLAPALPESPQRADDFADLMGLLKLEGSGGEVAVDADGEYRLHDARGREIRIRARRCEDGVACVDQVLLVPDPETRLQNIATADPRARLIEPSRFDDWPFLTERAVLRCEPPNALTLRSAEGLFALNGPGRSAETQPIDGILKDHPLRPGTKVAFGPVFFEAMTLCD